MDTDVIMEAADVGTDDVTAEVSNDMTIDTPSVLPCNDTGAGDTESAQQSAIEMARRIDPLPEEWGRKQCFSLPLEDPAGVLFVLTGLSLFQENVPVQPFVVRNPLFMNNLWSRSLYLVEDKEKSQVVYRTFSLFADEYHDYHVQDAYGEDAKGKSGENEEGRLWRIWNVNWGKGWEDERNVHKGRTFMHDQAVIDSYTAFLLGMCEIGIFRVPVKKITPLFCKPTGEVKLIEVILDAEEIASFSSTKRDDLLKLMYEIICNAIGVKEEFKSEADACRREATDNGRRLLDALSDMSSETKDAKNTIHGNLEMDDGGRFKLVTSFDWAATASSSSNSSSSGSNASIEEVD